MTATCADADSFEVFRNNARAGAVDNVGGRTSRSACASGRGNVPSSCEEPCGQGTLQPNPGVNGTRLGAPGQVQGIVASDNLCDRVHVTWTDLPEADSYIVRRQGVDLGTVAVSCQKCMTTLLQ
ncbi:MAG: hypothetical protein IPP40_09165 [bacterium]|nr:hypothetical protein [bacterium]